MSPQKGQTLFKSFSLFIDELKMYQDDHENLKDVTNTISSSESCCWRSAWGQNMCWRHLYKEKDAFLFWINTWEYFIQKRMTPIGFYVLSRVKDY